MKFSSRTAVFSGILATASVCGEALAIDLEISPIVDVSNMYLYRGEDIGKGDAQVSGGVRGSFGGFYSGIWGTSADDGEYDVYAGVAYGIGRHFAVDFSVWTYTYPHDDALDNFGQSSEVFLTLSWDNYSLTIVDNVAGDSGYMYYSLAAIYKQFSATVGLANPDTTKVQFSNTCSGTCESDPFYAGNAMVDYVHLDLTYAYNDNVKFTLSQIVKQDSFTLGTTQYEHNREDDTLFSVAYSIPLD